MGGIELFVLSMALGTDLFSVAIPIGMARIRLMVVLRAALVFALFHIVLILTGYYMGHSVGVFVEHVGAYHTDCSFLQVQNAAGVAGALVLMGLGLYMIKENLSGEPEQNKTHPLEGVSLLMLAASVSVDALAAGFSMGMMDVDLIQLSLILGAVIFTIALVGLGLGRQAGRWIGRWGELAGGSVLVLLGAHLLWTLIT